MHEKTPPILSSAQTNKRNEGFLSRDVVRGISSIVIVLCILVSVTACILAIWDFAKDGTLWRTVATCVIVSAGMVAFSTVNLVYGRE